MDGEYDTMSMRRNPAASTWWAMVFPEHATDDRNLMRSIEMAIEFAAQRAANDDFSAIEIVFRQLPSHDLLINLREIAELSGVQLTVAVNQIVICPNGR
jgi:hypothetical protein